MKHFHIEAIGGLAGDKFIAAMIDAEPACADELEQVLQALPVPRKLAVLATPNKNHQMSGYRFCVTAPEEGFAHYREIADMIALFGLAAPVKKRALDIFATLARAEAKVHGVALDEVHFHEVGNWYSIVDIVLAAHLIERWGKCSWSTGPPPLGEGFIECAHGRTPLPAPATLKMLHGFPVCRDGIKGERITPTGAAILSHRKPAYEAPAGTMRVIHSSVGFGTKVFEQISNVVCLIFLEEENPRYDADKVAVVRFAVDDLTSEDLAIAPEHIRGADGVLDVVQMPEFGKKSRILSRIEVLCKPQRLSETIEACFLQTSTIGLRWGIEARAVLRREAAITRDDDGHWHTKVATRPDGSRTAKLEADDVAQLSLSRKQRDNIRHAVESNTAQKRSITGRKREDG